LRTNALTRPKHEKRLARDLGRARWGDEGYAREELVAELGSAFLCADLGITPEVRDDHAAYIGHWLEKWRAGHFSTNREVVIM
jgi:antirestriction protein ArdC